MGGIGLDGGGVARGGPGERDRYADGGAGDDERVSIYVVA